MCSGSEAGSYLRLIDFVYQSTVGVRVIKTKKRVSANFRLLGKGNSNSHGARPVHLIITMIKWIWTSRLSIKNSLSMIHTCGLEGDLGRRRGGSRERAREGRGDNRLRALRWGTKSCCGRGGGRAVCQGDLGRRRGGSGRQELLVQS